MRAVQITRFGGPEVLDVVDLPDPVPGPGQQLYKVSAAGVNFADTHHPEAAHVGSGGEHFLARCDHQPTPDGAKAFSLDVHRPAKTLRPVGQEVGHRAGGLQVVAQLGIKAAGEAGQVGRPATSVVSKGSW